ncbi:MAG: hypothetical protein ACQESG_04255 [Nanobdellota archaeon]
MTRVHSHVLEKVISLVMFLFGLGAVWIFAAAWTKGIDAAELAIIEILLIIVLAILAQTVILIRIYEKKN